MDKVGPYSINSIVCDGCLNVLSQLPNECADLIYADMVYDDLDLTWVDECARVLKETGSIYIQTDYRSVAQVKLYLDNLLTFQNWIVWCYKMMPQRQGRYQRKHDDILFYTKSDAYTWNEPTQPCSESYLRTFRANDKGVVTNPTPAMKARGGKHYIRPVVCRDWWDDISIGYVRYDMDGGKQHPWQKPEKLLERIIEASSSIGDLVLDPFMGSGTTAVVARRLGRKFFGCDISKEYVGMANTRLRGSSRAVEELEVGVEQLSLLGT